MCFILAFKEPVKSKRGVLSFHWVSDKLASSVQTKPGCLPCLLSPGETGLTSETGAGAAQSRGTSRQARFFRPVSRRPIKSAPSASARHLIALLSNDIFPFQNLYKRAVHLSDGLWSDREWLTSSSPRPTPHHPLLWSHDIMGMTDGKTSFMEITSLFSLTSFYLFLP